MGMLKVFGCVLMILFALYDSASLCGLAEDSISFYSPSPGVWCLVFFTNDNVFRSCDGKCESSYWFNPVTSTSQSDLTDQAMRNCEGDVECGMSTSASDYSTENLSMMRVHLHSPGICLCPIIANAVTATVA